MHSARSLTRLARHALPALIPLALALWPCPVARADGVELESGLRFGGALGQLVPQPGLLVGLRLGDRFVLSTGGTFVASWGGADSVTAFGLPLALKLYVTEPAVGRVVPIVRTTLTYQWLSFENVAEARGVSASLSLGAQVFATEIVSVVVDMGLEYTHLSLLDSPGLLGSFPEHNVGFSSGLAVVLRP